MIEGSRVAVGGSGIRCACRGVAGGGSGNPQYGFTNPAKQWKLPDAKWR